MEDLYNPVQYNTSDNDLQETVTQNDERKHLIVYIQSSIVTVYKNIKFTSKTFIHNIKIY